MRPIFSTCIALLLTAVIAGCERNQSPPAPAITKTARVCPITANVTVENRGGAGLVEVRVEHPESGLTWKTSEYFQAGETRELKMKLTGHPMPSPITAHAIGVAGTSKSSVVQVNSEEH